MNRLSLIIAMFLVSANLLLFGIACGDGDEVEVEARGLNAQEAARLKLKFNIALVEKGGEPRLRIRETFTMPRDRIFLRLPSGYLRKTHLYQRIEDLSVSQPGQLLLHKDADKRILQFPAGQKVTLEYLYRPDDPINYTAGKETFWAPIVRKDYFQFVGSMLWVYPLPIMDLRQFTLSLEWDMPQDFKVFNSFGAEQNRQKLVTNFDKLRDAFFTGGSNIRAYKEDVRGKPVWITLEGHWANITDQTFVDSVTALLATQRAAFNDDNFPYFLVNFLALGGDCSKRQKFAGTAHPNSFRSFFPNGPNCNFTEEMKQLISHELTHAWIGKKIRVGQDRDFIDGKWFTEGYTDFLSRLFVYRANLFTEAEYFSSLNTQFVKYFTSQYRTITLKELVDNMYVSGRSSRQLENIPYQQGEIMAWRLNEKLKTATNFKHDVESVIRDMLTSAANAGGYKIFTVAEIAAHFDKYAPQVFMPEYEKIVRGNLLVPLSLAKCSNVKEQHVNGARVYYYGRFISSCKSWLN